MKEILLLSPEDQDKNSPTKILDKDLNKLQSFDAGFLFYFETLEYNTFHEALEQIFKLDSVFLVLGKLTEFGSSLEETRKSGPRRKKKGNPTIMDREGTEIVLDLDDHLLENYDPLKPVPAIKKWLKEKKISCDVTWQITSGQKLETNEARIRLYFETDFKYSLEKRKAWSQSPEIQADGSVYTCSQPIYTASPVILDGIDPIKRRSGFIKGLKRKFKLPKLTNEEVVRYSSFSRGGDPYDYNDPDLPSEVLNGTVYRRYFMPLAFHYANLLRGDREAIFNIIATKSNKVKSREFNAENTYSFIDDAIAKIDGEVEEKESDEHLLKAIDFSETATEKIPDFPEDIMDSWPEPWPMIWRNFKKIPRALEEPLLIPTILSVNSFFLKSAYVTAYGRRPNFFFLNLTPSTGNKDVNSKNVLRDLDGIFKKRGSLKSVFNGIVTGESSITADTTFLQSFNDSGEFFWINTEATRIFQQIKNSMGNSNVAALSDKLIEVVDGHEITGKVKAAGKVRTIEDPNAQILFYAQPETIEKFIDEEMVDSGLFGRSLLSILPELNFEPEKYNMFMNRDPSSVEVDDEFYNFYSSQKFNLAKMASHKKILAPSKANLELLNSWAQEHVAPLMKENDSFYKVLSRIGNSAEQLYTVILGICQIYDAFCDREIRKSVSVLPLIPLLEYWVSTKTYAIRNLVQTEMDPLAEGVLDVVQRFISGDYKAIRSNDSKILKDYSMVPTSCVLNAIRSRKKLMRKLDAGGDKRNAMERVNRIIQVFVKVGILEERLIGTGRGSKSCLGLIK